MSSHYSPNQGSMNGSRWKKLDAGELGLSSSMIPRSPWTVLNLLKKSGFDSYLVGGCVRDLLLNRIPKDFDVITTAKLTQIKKQFRHAIVVGRHFPICMVRFRDSVIEVSSFETVARTHTEEKDKFFYSITPKGCSAQDLILFKNSLQRDFTINGLFYDPFACKIYDYANGLADLKSMKLQTMIPAQLSFKEDPGRILRALRIAARLNLSLSREIASAIETFSSLVQGMNKAKLMVELNYILSYGAAEPSLSLLRKFKILDFLLPLHATYLDQQAIKQVDQSSSMLMKLFLHLDKLVACDRPSDCTTWVGLLAFHLALVNKPQDSLVVWAFASVLYHGEWKKGVEFAREKAKGNVCFSPEIRKSRAYKSDEEIARAVGQLASLVVDSIADLVNENVLLHSISRDPSSSGSGLVFVSRKKGKDVAQLFRVLIRDVDSYMSEKKDFEINYDLLGRGHPSEIRFVLGKIVLETMGSGIVEEKEVLEANKYEVKTEEDCDNTRQLNLPDPLNSQLVIKRAKRRASSSSSSSSSNPSPRNKKIKKHEFVRSECIDQKKNGIKKHGLLQSESIDQKKKGIKKHELVQSESIDQKKNGIKKYELVESESIDQKKRGIKKHKLVQSESIDQRTNSEKHVAFKTRKVEETDRKFTKLSALFK